jgi:hypothetical protein
MGISDEPPCTCAEFTPEPAYPGDLGWIPRNLIRNPENVRLLEREFPLPQGYTAVEHHLCPPCVTRARCGTPTFEAMKAYRAPEPARNGIACRMCHFARRRLVTDYLTGLGASILQDVSIEAGDNRAVYCNWLVTMTGATSPVALELDSADTFAPSNIIGDTAAFRIVVAREVFKSLYFRAQGVPIIRLKQNSMQTFDWRARLREALAARQSAVYLEADQADDSWWRIKGEIADWGSRSVAEWLVANERRLIRASDSDSGSEPDCDSEADSEPEAACDPWAARLCPAGWGPQVVWGPQAACDSEAARETQAAPELQPTRETQAALELQPARETQAALEQDDECGW